MRRSAGYTALASAVVFALLFGIIRAVEPFDSATIGVLPATLVVERALLIGLVIAGLFGLYWLVFSSVLRTTTKRRAHDVRNVLRLVFGAVGIISVLGILTEQWVGVLFSLGVLGFAVTFALQQPLLSLLGWFYVMAKRPYGVGDRVRIGEAKGDVIEVDFLVTTIWEVGGELVSTNQPSGRVVTVPNSVVLSEEVINFGGAGTEYIWTELPVQVAYESDIEFASTIMREETTAVIGNEMTAAVAGFRDRLAETPVELEVNDDPTVNVKQSESWVELRVRYVTHPRRGQQTRNELYRRILDRFREHPDRIAFPVSRNR